MFPRVLQSTGSWLGYYHYTLLLEGPALLHFLARGKYPMRNRRED